MKKRLLSILLTLCMALSLLPAVAFAEGGAKAIQSGTGSIHGYDTSAGGYSYIYYGTWRDSPIKWRVLDTKANTGAADALFLLTDECLYPLPGDLYACYIRFNPANKLNRHLWKDSTLQDWFKNTFYSGENSAFTSAECALIPATTALNTVAGDGMERGILAGANVVMPNLTPPRQRSRYLLYDNKTTAPVEQIDAVTARIEALGYRVAVSRGDSRAD